MAIIQNASKYSISELVNTFNIGFQEYFVTVSQTEASFRGFIRDERIDFGQSFVAILTISLPALPSSQYGGSERRLAAMSILKTFRRLGLGRLLLSHVIMTPRFKMQQKYGST